MVAITVVCEYGTRNGGERSLLAVLDNLPPETVAVSVLAPPQGRLAEELAARGIEHCPLTLHAAGRRVPPDEACRRLEAGIRFTRPDRVHANSLSMGRLTGAIAARLDAPCSAHLRDIISLSRAAVADLNQNQRLIAVSHATRDFHVGQGLAAERIQVIPNGVDCERFQPRPASGWLRRELGLPPAALLVATIGQIGLRKGQDVLAEAAVLNARRLPQAHYVVIGERNSSKAESIAFDRQLGARFSDAGLGDRLHRLGYRTDVERLLNELDLLVHPARQEPLGRVLLEAAACGVPIVATRVGGTPEILDDASALLVPPDDAAALADAIVRLANDASLRRELAANARRRAVSSFNIRDRAAELAAVWTS